MAFKEALAERIRQVLARQKGIKEMTLFGCACFLLRGNVLVGTWKDSLIARVGPNGYEDALKEPHVKEFDITGKPMTGWVRVGPGGIEEEQLQWWIQQAVKFVGKLPANE
jgi:hypothetical protein